MPCNVEIIIPVSFTLAILESRLLLTTSGLMHLGTFKPGIYTALMTSLVDAITNLLAE